MDLHGLCITPCKESHWCGRLKDAIKFVVLFLLRPSERCRSARKHCRVIYSPVPGPEPRPPSAAPVGSRRWFIGCKCCGGVRALLEGRWEQPRGTAWKVGIIKTRGAAWPGGTVEEVCPTPRSPCHSWVECMSRACPWGLRCLWMEPRRPLPGPCVSRIKQPLSLRAASEGGEGGLSPDMESASPTGDAAQVSGLPHHAPSRLALEGKWIWGKLLGVKETATD